MATPLIGLIDLDWTLRRSLSLLFLARLEFFAQIRSAHAKLANSFINIVVESLKEPCVCRRRDGYAGDDGKKRFHRVANYLSADHSVHEIN